MISVLSKPNKSEVTWTQYPPWHTAIIQPLEHKIGWNRKCRKLRVRELDNIIDGNNFVAKFFIGKFAGNAFNFHHQSSPPYLDPNSWTDEQTNTRTILTTLLLTQWHARKQKSGNMTMYKLHQMKLFIFQIFDYAHWFSLLLFSFNDCVATKRRIGLIT